MSNASELLQRVQAAGKRARYEKDRTEEIEKELA